ncbi:hypothetical protein AAC387_Pa05g3328 [Persea americana]
MGYKRKRNYLILPFYFTLIGNGTVLRLQLDTHTALPLLAWAVNSHFQVFLRSERKEPANCSFTAALAGGKLAVAALPLLSSAVNRIFLFSSSVRGGKLAIAALPPLIGGKVDFPVFLRSERRKTGNCRHPTGTFWLESFDPIFYPFFLIVAPSARPRL